MRLILLISQGERRPLCASYLPDSPKDGREAYTPHYTHGSREAYGRHTRVHTTYKGRHMGGIPGYIHQGGIYGGVNPGIYTREAYMEGIPGYIPQGGYI